MCSVYIEFFFFEAAASAEMKSQTQQELVKQLNALDETRFLPWLEASPFAGFLLSH